MPAESRSVRKGSSNSMDHFNFLPSLALDTTTEDSFLIALLVSFLLGESRQRHATADLKEAFTSFEIARLRTASFAKMIA
jgi:hypothetical protein